MSKVTYNLSNYDNMTVQPAAARQDSNLQLTRILLGDGDVLELDISGTSDAWLVFRIPNKLPVGTKVTFSAQTRNLSGASLDMNFVSFADAEYGGDSGTGGTETGDLTTKIVTNYITETTNTVSTPSEPYISCRIGIPSGSAGINHIRAVSISIENENLDEANHDYKNLPVISGQTYDAYAFEQRWNGTTTGAGSVTFVTGSHVSIDAAYADTALLALNTSADTIAAKAVYKTANLDGSKGIFVQADITRFSGHPMIAVSYLDAGESVVATVRCTMNKDVGLQDIWFPMIDGAENAYVVVGQNATSEADFQIRSLTVNVLGASTLPDTATSIIPFATHLAVTGGAWFIDQTEYGLGQFCHLGVESVTQDTNSINIQLKTECARGLPILLGQIDDVGYDVQAFPSTSDHTIYELVIVDRGTTSIVNPNTLPDNTRISVVGLGGR